MKKLLIKMAAGMFLTALSFMQANAGCGLVPTITVQPGTHCAGDIITILGVNRASGSSSFTMDLRTTDGTNTGVIATITQTGRNVTFYHTVTTADGAVLTMNVKVNIAADCNTGKISLSGYEYVDVSLTAWNVTVSGNVCSGPSYLFTLDGTDGSAATYYAYRNGIFLNSLVGDDMGTTPNFGPVSVVGAYTIVAHNPATGCTANQIGTLNINQTPAVPTYTYTWCGAGALLLQGATTTTLAGVSYVWIDQSTNATSTGQNITITSPPGHAYKSLTTLNGCSSALSASFTPTQNYFPAPYLSNLHYYKNDQSGYIFVFTPTGTFNLRDHPTDTAAYHFFIVGSYTAPGITNQWRVDATAGGSHLPIYGPHPDYVTFPMYSNANGAFYLEQTNVCGTVATNKITLNFCTGCGSRKGIDDTDEGSTSILYPNPASNELNINSPYDNYKINISDITGKVVLSKQVYETTTKLDLSSFNAGTYVVKLVSVEGTITKQIQVVK